MLIKLKNKETLVIDDFRFNCSVGKKGTKNNKIEGDKATPKGLFSLGKLYYRPDRVNKPETKLKINVIKKNMGWCNDSNSKDYNKLIKLPATCSFEKLYKKENIYDIVLVLNYNMRPIVKNKGSAIFIHVAKKKIVPTKGCIAINKKELLKLLEFIKKTSLVKIT